MSDHEEEGELEMDERDERADDDDDDEEEEESEEEGRATKKRRRRVGGANRFVDDVAIVDDDEEDEDEEVEGMLEQEEEIEENIGKEDDSAHRKYDRELRGKEERNAEEVARELDERYKNQRSKGYRADAEVAEHMLVPAVADPSLWLVKCRQGREKDLIMQLMRKYCELEYREDKLDVISAFTRDNLPGYIYVEAKKQVHVQKALDGITGFYLTSIKVVPLDDMVACLRIKSKEKDIKEGSWVRVKAGKGKYEGDLAKVMNIVEGGAVITIKLVPRIDLSDKNDSNDDPSAKRKKRAVPKPKLIDRNSRAGVRLSSGEELDKEGYLLKDIPVSSLETERINPTLEEITAYTRGSVNERADWATLAAQSTVEEFHIGENVEVSRGEMKNLTGRVLSIENGIVTIMPSKEAHLGAIKFDVKDLRKRFDEGDNVKVINGMHSGETGLIIKIANGVATIFSEASTKPVEVFTKDLRIASDVSSTASVGMYDVQDAVQITPQDVGVIVKIEKDMLSVLNQYGNVVKVSQQAVRRLDKKRAVTSDSVGRATGAGDSVVVTDPPGSSTRRGTVIHIHRSSVFVFSREVIDNGGIFVTKSANINLLSGNIRAQSNGGMSIRGQNGPPRSFGRGRGRGRDPLISKTVTITGGPYKGYLGIVKDMTDSGARVELHTNSRIITIPQQNLREHGQNVNVNSDFAYRNSYASYGSNNNGGRTPAYSGSRTPMHRADGAMTPHYDGSRTPAWDSGSRTPAHPGSRTPAWEAGSRTPARDSAWDASSKTPKHPTSDYSSFPFQSALGDNTEPESPYNPSTPHVYGAGADQTTPYNPQTPGYVSLPQTPGDAYPNALSVQNTGGEPNTPLNPSTPFNPTTPFPSTPYAASGGESFANPGDRHRADEAEDWLTTDIEVTIVPKRSTRESFKNGEHNSCKAVIRAVESARVARVILSTGSREILSVPIDFLEVVCPEKKGPLKVIRGEFAGQLGSLIAPDDQDGIVKLNNSNSSDFKIIPLVHLAKHVPAV